MVDGGQGAGQPRGGTEFPEGQVGLLGQQRPELLLMVGDNAGLGAGAVVLGADVADLAALLEELLDHAQRNPETAGHLLAAALVGVVGRQDQFAEIQRDGLHPKGLPNSKQNGYVFV